MNAKIPNACSLHKPQFKTDCKSKLRVLEIIFLLSHVTLIGLIALQIDLEFALKLQGVAKNWLGDRRIENIYSLLIAFESCRDREHVMTVIVTSRAHDNDAKIPCHTDRDFIIEAVKGWKEGTISNFDYLLACFSYQFFVLYILYCIHCI